MKNGKERRSAPRIPVEVAVTLPSGRGRTRDVSRCGFYFFTEARRSLVPGMPIRVVLELDHVFADVPVYIDCLARVVRIEEGGEVLGVAAAISEFCGAA